MIRFDQTIATYLIKPLDPMDFKAKKALDIGFSQPKVSKKWRKNLKIRNSAFSMRFDSQ